MASFNSLAGDQMRQLLNSEQLFDAFRAAQKVRDERFRGSMAWKTVKGRKYLYRKRHDRWESLGPMSAETEAIRTAFQTGRAEIRARIKSLDAQIRSRAPINRAMGLGRLPFAAARILRRLERARLLGENLTVVGTHALFAYERMAGVHLHSSQVATDDIDLMFDDRQRLRLITRDEQSEGLIGILRAADESFATISSGSFRAVDAKGFMVDLIKPMPSMPAASGRRKRVGTNPDDLHAAEIEGLSWLQNSPQLQQIVIDERGFPARLDVPDPRAFCLHKYWVSQRADRDPIKARRDVDQARTLAFLIERYMPQYTFDEGGLTAFPVSVRAALPRLRREALKLSDLQIEVW